MKRVRHSSALGRWSLARLAALALLVALAPLPVWAAPPPGAPAGKTTIRQSAAAIGASQSLAATPNPSAQAGNAGKDTGSPAFFKRPIGIAVLATLAAGVGYAVYSAKHDRITSPGKK